MTEPGWLPNHMRAAPFTLSEAEAIGIGSTRRHGGQLLRPFRGIRATRPPADVVEQCLAYAPRLRPGQAFGGSTALRLLGLPWTRTWRLSDPVEIVVAGRGYLPSSRGVRSHRRAAHRMPTVEVLGLPVLEPLAAVMDVADRVTPDYLVGLLDALVTSSDRYPDLRWRPMVSDLRGIEAFIDQWGRGAEAARARRALERVRVGVESVQESRTRVLLEDAGAPQVVIQHEIATDDGVKRVDGAWPDFAVGFDYEGDHHRTDPQQWDADIGRFEALQQAGWTVIRVTARDLWEEGRAGLFTRVHAALRSRGWQGPKKSYR